MLRRQSADTSPFFKKKKMSDFLQSFIFFILVTKDAASLGDLCKRQSAAVKVIATADCRYDDTDRLSIGSPKPGRRCCHER